MNSQLILQPKLINPRLKRNHTSRIKQFRDWMQLLYTHHKPILTMNERNINFVYKHNARRYLKIADDKAYCKELMKKLDVPVPELLAHIEKMGDIEATLQKLESCSSIVLKPTHGRGGGGILVLDRIGECWKSPSGKMFTSADLQAHIARILFGSFSGSDSDTAIVEEKVVPHKQLRNLYSDGVADIRVIVFHGKPVAAMLRVPTASSDGKANLHQGAVGVGVDLESGFMTGGKLKGRDVKIHPDSRTPLKGQRIPYFKEILTISRLIGNNMPLKYLGVDIVIDKNKGPMVLEINARPGLEIQNVNGIGLRTALLS